MSKQPSLSLVIPAYNEEENIVICASNLVRAFDKESIDYEFLIVDNGSTDKTGEIIDSLAKRNKRIKKVVVKKNIGYGYGIRKGLETAHGTFIGWIDADNQVDVNFAVRLFKKIERENLDMVISQSEQRGDSITRHIASFFYNSFVSLLFLTNMRDANAKPKIFKKKAYSGINMTSDDWFIDTELLLKFRAKEYSIGKLKCIYKQRPHGQSNVRLGTVFEFLKNLALFRLGVK